jgi:hypothetical protein
MVANIDPIGRMSLIGQAAFSTPGSWRGVSGQAALRRLRVELGASAWYLEHEPSKSRDHLAPIGSDLRYAGGGVHATLADEVSSSEYLLRAGAGAGQVNNALLSSAGRWSTFIEARGRLSRSFGSIASSVAARAFGELGATDGESWERAISSATLSVGNASRYLRGDWLRGSVSHPTTEGNGRELEQFVVGGSSNPLIDPAFLAQRISLPAVPAGMVSGRRVQLFRTAVGLRSWEPYYTWVAGGESLDDLKRIAGVERTFAISSLAFARVPAVRARAGASWSFDEPYKDRPRIYFSVTYSP